MAQPFDPDKLELTGDPVPVAEEIRTVSRPEIGLFSASANGVLVFLINVMTPDAVVARQSSPVIVVLNWTASLKP